MIKTDTGAKKWENSDNWRQIYQAHNESVDAEDAAIAALQDGLAIVANGNTHAAIAAGQFVFVKNHDTLAAGLYTANAAIAANATLTSSNLTADPNGGLNALNSKLTQNTYSSGNMKLVKTNDIVILTMKGSAKVANMTIPSGYRPSVNTLLPVVLEGDNTTNVYITINTDGTVTQSTGSNNWVVANGSWSVNE